MQQDTYLENLRQAAGAIWSCRPEFVLELGGNLFLADLCREFTTVISVGFSKKLPVTTAPLVVMPSAYSKEEKQEHWELLARGQRIVEMDMDMRKLHEQERNPLTKESFGIPGNAFVVIIAGNRLDIEVTDAFLSVMHQILEIDCRIVFAIFGNCPKLEKRAADERIFFLGGQSNLRDATAMGDVFLNPPRDGGGTSGLFAILEEVPVITLDDCDVQLHAGADFVCSDVAEMPGLVCRYFSDKAFMERQKQNCRKRTKEIERMGDAGGIRKLCEAAREYALEQESAEGATAENV